ncbi:hypothetical protein I4U23_022113 [Adineta vaga]|nr:hypothetical protein I4U23_022113 [Adineta vaga]
MTSPSLTPPQDFVRDLEDLQQLCVKIQENIDIKKFRIQREVDQFTEEVKQLFDKGSKEESSGYLKKILENFEVEKEKALSWIHQIEAQKQTVSSQLQHIPGNDNHKPNNLKKLQTQLQKIDGFSDRYCATTERNPSAHIPTYVLTFNLPPLDFTIDYSNTTRTSSNNAVYKVQFGTTANSDHLWLWMNNVDDDFDGIDIYDDDFQRIRNIDFDDGCRRPFTSGITLPTELNNTSESQSQSQQQDTTINIDDRCSPSCASVLSNIEIVDNVIERSRRLDRQRWLSLFIGCIPTFIITCLMWIIRASGIVFACVTGLIFFGNIYYGAKHYFNGQNYEYLRNSVRYLIKLEVQQWISYVNYLYGPDCSAFAGVGTVGAFSFCCRKPHY